MRPSFLPNKASVSRGQTREAPGRGPTYAPTRAPVPSSDQKAQRARAAQAAADHEGSHRFPCLFGLHDLSRLDTTPGAKSPFAPRADWHPTPQEYIAALRAYCVSPCGPWQTLQSVARHAVIRRERGGRLPEVIGPYAESLNQILAAFVRKIEQGPVTDPETASTTANIWRKIAPPEPHHSSENSARLTPTEGASGSDVQESFSIF